MLQKMLPQRQRRKLARPSRRNTRTEILAEAAKKNEVQVGQQELFDYAIQMSQTTAWTQPPVL